MTIDRVTPDTPGIEPPQRSAQLVRWKGVTKLDLQPEVVLNAALATNLKCVVVLGYDDAGEEYFASSMADGADCLWLLERMKHRLLTIQPPTTAQGGTTP
jgi:hypothetical protein